MNNSKDDIAKSIGNQPCGAYLLTNDRHKSGQVPEDILVEILNDYQIGKLRRLKDWLYRQRVKVRQEGERADKRL